MTEWAEFTERLAEQLAVLPAGAIVKIVEAGPPSGHQRFAQFAQTDNELLAELVGDEFLEPAARPDETGHRLITESGWQEPDDDHGPYWWIELPWPVNSAIYRQLAAMVVTGLRDAFRISDPGSLTYTAWNKNADERDLHLPLLGLARQD
ncbi:TY-Chap domain-containing protein [Nocardia anaemiae]|uniref:TY-Chap domain-containing protein n=1 Tax=Nocardia anaemiae TaxID=263910 RepID=UPI0007A4B391